MQNKNNKPIKINVPDNIYNNWQQIVDILAQIIQIPAALIMRLDDPNIEVFVSSKSEGNPYGPGDKEYFWNSGLYCETAIKTQKKLLVPNALADENWKDNPDIKLNMVSYLGYPIFTPDRQPFGTICVLDDKPNEYSENIELLISNFRDLIESNLEIIYMNQTLGDENKRLSDYLYEIQFFRGLVSICSNCKSIKDKNGSWHPIEKYLIKNPNADFSHGICPDCMKKLYPDFTDS